MSGINPFHDAPARSELIGRTLAARTLAERRFPLTMPAHSALLFDELYGEPVRLNPKRLAMIDLPVPAKMVTAPHLPARPSPCPSCGDQDIQPPQPLDVWTRCPNCRRFVALRRCHADLWGNPDWRALAVAVSSAWGDWNPRGVAADWLDEHGCIVLAFMLRNGWDGLYDIRERDMRTVIQPAPQIFDKIREQIEKSGRAAHAMMSNDPEPFCYDLPNLPVKMLEASDGITKWGQGYSLRCGLIAGVECTIARWFMDGRAVVAHPYNALTPETLAFRGSHPAEPLQPYPYPYSWVCPSTPAYLRWPERLPGFVPRPIFDRLAGGKPYLGRVVEPDNDVAPVNCLGYDDAAKALRALRAAALAWATSDPATDPHGWKATEVPYILDNTL